MYHMAGALQLLQLDSQRHDGGRWQGHQRFLPRNVGKLLPHDKPNEISTKFVRIGNKAGRPLVKLSKALC
jgi:hypothetical protein